MRATQPFWLKTPRPRSFALGGCAGVLELRRQVQLLRRLLARAWGLPLARSLDTVRIHLGYFNIVIRGVLTAARLGASTCSPEACLRAHIYTESVLLPHQDKACGSTQLHLAQLNVVTEGRPPSLQLLLASRSRAAVWTCSP